ncbi:MAG TPA: phosphoglycerate mutase family protein [Candidatus Limnocylindrales bacterium]|nr:phosphoglycerate mutase family protein [Candidatus Limnocylindrales bacterium]
MKHLFTRIGLAALLLSQMAAAQNVHTIFLVRHGERASAAADSALSPAGEARAACLAQMLKDADIKQIYVTEVKRTQQTAAPLASQLKLKPTIIPAKDPNTLIRDLAYAGTPGNILVVGHSNTLPFIIVRLKAGTVPPIGENEYDRMFVVTETGGAASPVTTLHYCESGAPAASVARPKMPPKAATKKPAKKKP